MWSRSSAASCCHQQDVRPPKAAVRATRLPGPQATRRDAMLAELENSKQSTTQVSTKAKEDGPFSSVVIELYSQFDLNSLARSPRRRGPRLWFVGARLEELECCNPCADFHTIAAGMLIRSRWAPHRCFHRPDGDTKCIRPPCRSKWL